MIEKEKPSEVGVAGKIVDLVSEEVTRNFGRS